MNKQIFVFQMLTGVLKHTPPSASSSSTAASSSAFDQKSNAQTVPTILRGHLVVGSKDRLRLLTPVSGTAVSNHCAASGAHGTKHSGGAPRPPSSLSEEDDGGGGVGGGRVKKKHKKKDKREREKDVGEVEDRESSKPKKRKEEKAATAVMLRRSKEPKEGKEQRERKSRGKEASKELKKVAIASTPAPVKVPGKRGRKPKIKVLPPVPPPQGMM